MGVFDQYEDTGGGSEGDGVAWKPTTAGDVAEGVLRSVKDIETKFGPKVLIVLNAAKYKSEGGAAETADELEWWVRAETNTGRPTQPLTELQSVAADIGDRVRVSLTELRDVGKGNPMKVFAAEVIEKGSSTPAPAAADNDPFA